MARKDSGNESRRQHRPAETPPEKAVHEAPGRRRTRRPTVASNAIETPIGAPARATPTRRRSLAGAAPAEGSEGSGLTPSTPENPELAIPAGATPTTPITSPPPVADEVARKLEREPAPAREIRGAVLGDNQPALETPEGLEVVEAPHMPNPVLEDAMQAEEEAYTSSIPPPRARRRERQRAPHGNALGILIERHFTEPTSPVRSYSDLERRSGISREALSRYVTARADRRRSPTIDTLVAIADAMHLSLEAVSRAAAASVHGVIPPSEEEQHAREAILSGLVAGLTDEQFNAVVELLRHLRPAPQPPKV